METLLNIKYSTYKKSLLSLITIFGIASSVKLDIKENFHFFHSIFYVWNKEKLLLIQMASNV